MTLSARLYEMGLLVPGIRPPSVPEGECLLRVSLSCGHTQQHLDTFGRRVNSIAEVANHRWHRKPTCYDANGVEHSVLS